MGCICRFRFADGAGWRIKHVCRCQDFLPRRVCTTPATNTTPAAWGSSCTSRGSARTRSCAQALQVLINLLHRGACGCEANTGDGAGILIQMPDRFLRRETARLGFALPPERHYGAGFVFLPRDPALRRRDRGADRAHRRRGRAAVPRLARRADRRRGGRAERGGGRAGVPAAVRRARADGGDRRRRRRVVRAEALRDPQAGRARRGRDGARRPERVLRAEPVVADADLQGHAHGGPDRADVPRPGGSGRRVRAGAGAPAVQHEHVPVLAARASLPLRRAQRRDQHAARQHQLDEGARGAARVRRARRRPEEDPADHPRRGQRHRDLRQRARVPRHGRPVAAARRADDDPRAVAEPRGHERRSCGRSTSTTRR